MSASSPVSPKARLAVAHLLAQLLERLERSVSRGEDGRQRLDATLAALAERIGALGDRMGQEQELLQRLAQSQELIAERVSRREGVGAGPALDEATRGHIRNTDMQLGRLVDELSRGREEMTRELRGEIKLVARTIALAAGETQPLRD